MKTIVLPLILLNLLFVHAALGQMLVNFGDTWKYYDNGNHPGMDWNSQIFNDTGWNSGNGEFGYGDGDENTVLSYGSNASQKHISYYFRKNFLVNNLSSINTFKFEVKRDDGIIIYLNGIEIFRNNMPSGTISNSTLALSAIAGAAEYTPLIFYVDSTNFENGNNTLAVEIHQASASSSDLSFDLQLTGLLSPPLTVGQIRWGSQNSPLEGLSLSWKGKGTSDSIKWGYQNINEMGTFSTNNRPGYEDRFNSFTFPSLTPDQRLFYQIYDSFAQKWTDTLFFNTASDTATNEFSFNVLGDSRSGLNIWQQISFQAGVRPTDFTLFNGDIVADGSNYNDWNNWFNFASDYIGQNLIYHALGNHDASSIPDYQNIYDLPTTVSGSNSELYYAFRHANALFICLNSESPSDINQYNWLLSTLQNNQEVTWKIIFFHRPFYTIGYHMGEMNNYYSTWWKAFDDYGVDIIFTGHDHMYERTKPINRNLSTTNPAPRYGSGPSDGRCQIVCGGAGAPLYSAAPMWFIETYRSSYNFCKIDINNKLLCDSTFDENGALIETFCIDKSEQPGGISGVNQIFNPLACFPNPFIDKVDISYKSDDLGPLEINLLDGRGRNVIKKQLTKNSQIFTIQLETQDISKGIYFLHLTTKNYSDKIMMVKY